MRSAFLLVFALALAGCNAPAVDDEEAPRGAFTLTSPAFLDGEPIPEVYTCDGENISPPLFIAGVPRDATAIALIVGDPDTPLPQAPQRNITHWLLWNAPVDANGTVVFAQDAPPPGSREGANEGGGPGWMGPCPPPVSPAHRYMFTAYALDTPLELDPGATRAELEAALDGRVRSTTTLTGTYARALTLP